MIGFDAVAVEKVKRGRPSWCKQLKITDVNRMNLEKKEQLHMERLGRDFDWLEVSMLESLLDADNLIRVVWLQKGKCVACPEKLSRMKKNTLMLRN